MFRVGVFIRFDAVHEDRFECFDALFHAGYSAVKLLHEFGVFGWVLAVAPVHAFLDDFIDADS